LKSANFTLPRARRTLTQACRFSGMFQFAMPTFESVFGRMAKGNSPLGAWVVCVYR